MKVNLAKSAGFCFGVKRALKVALATAKSHKKVYMLGDIVHNEDVVRAINKAGIKKINNLRPGKNKILLIRAHGASLKTIRKAKRLGFNLVDATCPMVKEIHRIATAMEKDGYQIIVIGDKKHDEVQGIIGQLKGKAILIDDKKNIPINKIKKVKKACVVAQSTQSQEKVTELTDILSQNIKELKVFNTICMPTRMKQNEIKRMPKENDVMIIIGSKTSANTKRLYEISKSINPRSYWVRSEKDISPAWFTGVKMVGVTAGASTPESTTKNIIKYLSCLS
jgi:4-hydroxy-3-methylbut-2-en-1-yl diphosphate reductase